MRFGDYSTNTQAIDDFVVKRQYVAAVQYNDCQTVNAHRQINSKGKCYLVNFKMKQQLYKESSKRLYRRKKTERSYSRWNLANFWMKAFAFCTVRTALYFCCYLYVPLMYSCRISLILILMVY